MATAHDFRAPTAVRVANRLLGAGRPVGLAPQRPSAQEIIDQTMRSADPADQCDVAYEPAFRSAMASAAEDSALTPFGRWSLRSIATRMLSNRLAIAQTIRRHPEIEEIPIERPVVIVGWFRSGTTLLHRLLASGNGVRVPRAWELYYPAPRAGRGRDRRARRRRMRRQLRLVHLVIPNLDDLHAIDANDAAEATVLLDNEGVGAYFLHTFGAHSHGEFLAHNDLGYAYRSMKRQLQLLTWADGGGRWVLKCPFSLWALDALLDVFPDAEIVQTHRDPAEALASECNLSSVLQRSFCERVDPDAIGRFWSGFYLDGIRRSATARDARPDADVRDVDYRELTTDTRGLVTRLADDLDLPRPSVPQQPVAPPQRARPPLEAFGLSPAGIDELFADREGQKQTS